MNPLLKYKDQRIAILCKTYEEAQRIGTYIIELGGRKVHNEWNSYEEETCICCENISSAYNCYASLPFYNDMGYPIIPSEGIQEGSYEPSDYPIY